MMIRWTAGVALVIAVLAPVQALAECAWVLWEHAAEQTWWGWGPQRLAWTPIGGVSTREDCEKEQARHQQAPPSGFAAWKAAREKGKPEPAPYATWRCLPDTIDPRGPKTK